MAYPTTEYYKVYRRFKYQTFIKFLFSFVLLLLATVNISSWYFYYTTTRQLDDELGERLASLASTCAIALDGEVLAMLRPGDEGSLLYRQLQAQLERMQEATKAKVYLVDKENRYLVDVKGEYKIGSENLFLRLDEQELRNVRLGQSAFSILYKGTDGKYYKSGYAPVRNADGEVVAVLVAEARAQFFDGIKLTRRRLFYIGGISALIAVAISAFFAQSLVAPLQKLVKTAQKIEAGDLSARVKLNKRNEFGFLSSAFDKMVDALEERETE
ncbi:MAG: HAMP domain-containing protein, partial [Candidatus Poribacteria bacterium]